MSLEITANKKEIQRLSNSELQKPRDARRVALETDMVFPKKRELQSSAEMRTKAMETTNQAEQKRTAEGLFLRDLTDAERQKLKDIGMTSANIDKCKVDRNSVFHLDCRNSDLEGNRHPMTGVSFERQRIRVNGVTIEGVFPKFQNVVEYQLPERLRLGTESEQFRYLNGQLREQIGKDPGLRAKFTEQQIQMIESGRNPAGFTWHHNESYGRMQLVETSKHAATGHTGGDSIWCGR